MGHKKKLELILSEDAEQDIKDSKEYYEAQREGLGNELVTEVEVTLNNIIRSPGQFPIVKKDIRKAIVNRFPFTIFFVFTDSLIHVLSIFHSSRNPTIWEKRAK